MSLPTLTLFGLGAAVVLSLAGPAATLTWHLLGDSAVAPRPLPARGTDTEAPGPVDLSPVIALAPFGAVPSEAAAPAQETRLDLVLHGVAISTDPSRSAAFIASEGRTERYHTGDAVAANVRLVAVEPDHVRIKTDGGEEVLSFPEAAESGGDSASATLTGLERLRAATSGGGATAAPQSTEDHIDLWRQRIKRNPGEVLDTIGLVPGDNGYTIAEQHDSGVRKIGLKAGDLVTRVNGQAVGNVEKDKDLYDEIAASGVVRVEVERDGQAIVMTFPLR